MILLTTPPATDTGRKYPDPEIAAGLPPGHLDLVAGGAMSTARPDIGQDLVAKLGVIGHSKPFLAILGAVVCPAQVRWIEMRALGLDDGAVNVAGTRLRAAFQRTGNVPQKIITPVDADRRGGGKHSVKLGVSQANGVHDSISPSNLPAGSRPTPALMRARAAGVMPNSDAKRSMSAAALAAI